MLQSPYSTAEILRWICKNIFANPAKLNSTEKFPRKTTLNKIDPLCTIIFFGDVMDLGGKRLVFSDSLLSFFESSNYFIGNFEATISNARKSFFLDQSHDERILSSLSRLMAPQNTFLSIANNHAGDFSDECFETSLKLIIDAGFNTFGLRKKSFVDITEDIRIIGASSWSNNKEGFNRIQDLAKLNEGAIKYGSMNILFPHWGFELEYSPRKDCIRNADELLKKYDFIVGHHPHFPQLIKQKRRNQVNSLVAYSLGDFCFGVKSIFSERYCFGKVIKLNIGKIGDAYLAIGDVEWRYVRSHIGKNKVLLDFIDHC